MARYSVPADPRWLLSLVVVLSLLGSAQLGAQPDVTVRSQEQGTVSFEVESHRPLSDAVRALSARYGLVITYEDPRWAHSSEIEEVPLRNPKASGERYAEDPDDRPLRPRAGKLEFTYQESELEAGREGIVNVLEGLIEASSQPYEVRDQAGVFHLVPTWSLDASGEQVSHQSPLDVQINLPFERRTIIDTLEAILEAVNEVSDTPVEFGLVMIKPFRRWTVDLGSTGRSARELLVEAMRTDKLTTSWLLFYNPRRGRYAFSVYHMNDLKDNDLKD